MMNYENFKKIVTERIKDYLPKKLQGMTVRVNSVRKINVELDALSLLNDVAGVNIAAPIVYINHLYNDYKRTEDLDGCLNNAAIHLANGFAHNPTLSWENAKDNIVFQLINTEQNKKMLSDMPNRPFHDLSIIYRWIISTCEDGGIGSVIINNYIAKQLDITESQLFKLAAKNTLRLFPPVVKSLNDTIRDMLVTDGVPGSIAERMTMDMMSDELMWVITNKYKWNGAVSMLYEDKLHNLAEKLESDLCIMPSSRHEVIAVPVNMVDVNIDSNKLAAIVREVNKGQVELEDRLSNQVYYYDRKLRILTLATNSPNMRVDDLAIEA